MRWGVGLLVSLFTTIAWGQTPAPAATPPAPAPAATPAPAPAAPAPPPQYPPYPYPPPGYAYPPPVAYQAPEELPYKEGAPIPVGYHVEERPRKGLVNTGWILTGISYGLSVIVAVSADFRNHSGWLAVPFAGPWLTLGRRNYSCDENNDPNQEDGKEGLDCLGDTFVVMGLILDGAMQAAGGTLLLIGYSSPKKHVIRDSASVRVRPIRIGSGHGLGVSGTF